VRKGQNNLRCIYDWGIEVMTVLAGLKVVEFEGIGPGPFCGMLFADLGADVIAIERAGAMSAGKSAVFRRGKRSIALNLKKSLHKEAAIKIVSTADAIIEGYRPGVMERLGLGPDVLCGANKKLVYGRLTGWGQNGPLSQTAGHDINYTGLSGAAWYAGAVGEAPLPPPTLVGDIGGGSLYLAIGILSAVLKAREGGRGSVVDAAIVDGSAHMMNLLMSLRAAGGLPEERGQSILDGGHFYGTYQCSDGRYISIGPLEPQFYVQLLEKLGLTGNEVLINQFAVENWLENKKKFEEIFLSRTMKEWQNLLEGTDVCFAPILSPDEARYHPHMQSRDIYREVDGVLQTAAAPRFDGVVPADPKPPVSSGANTNDVLREVGFSEEEIENLTGGS